MGRNSLTLRAGLNYPLVQLKFGTRGRPGLVADLTPQDNYIDATAELECLQSLPQPAAKWSESLFIGNGRLGGAVWGGVQRGRIDLNEETLCSGEPYENINPNSLPALPEIRRLLLAGKELEAQQMVESKMLGRYNENCFSAGGMLSVTNPVNPPGHQRFYRLRF